jgi:hypothetical protein
MVKIKLRNFEKLVNDLIIQKLMYGKGFTNVKYGSQNEKIALQKYIHLYKQEVIDCGLVIHTYCCGLECCDLFIYSEHFNSLLIIYRG